MYMSLTKYALQRAQLLFRISFLSLVSTRLSSHSFPRLHGTLNSVDAERLPSSKWVVPLQRNETSHWIKAGLVPPIGRSASLGVYGAVGGARLAWTLSFCMMIGLSV